VVDTRGGRVFLRVLVEAESRIMWFLWNRPDDPTLSAGIEDRNLDSYYDLTSADQFVPMIEIVAMEYKKRSNGDDNAAPAGTELRPHRASSGGRAVCCCAKWEN
jgi:hypothetical protein